jgi:hypothetical protein
MTSWRLISMATTDRSSTTSTRTTDAAEGIGQTARSVADTVAGAAGEVGARLPEVAQTTRDAFAETNRMVQQGSDQTLKVLGAASVGLAAGLLLGGANRVVVVAAMLPAALIGATLVERAESGTTPATTRASRS